MKTIYVVGAGVGISAIEQARKILELPEEANIICVSSPEEIPFSARLSSDAATIQTIHKLTDPPPMPEIKFHDYESKRKSHERPYKFHR